MLISATPTALATCCSVEEIPERCRRAVADRAHRDADQAGQRDAHAESADREAGHQPQHGAADPDLLDGEQQQGMPNAKGQRRRRDPGARTEAAQDAAGVRVPTM